jgi:hypothetical protein
MPDLNDLIQGTSDETKHFEILKELTKEEIARLFSELTDNEVKSLTRLEYLSRLLKKTYGKNVLNLDVFIHTFMTMRISKGRKSRGEFVDAFKSERAESVEKSLLGKANKFIR